MTPALPTPRLERAPRPEADTDSGPLADPAPAAPPSRASKPALLYRLCKDAVMAWIDDFAPSMGAAISYYTMFSLAPLLVIVIAVAGALFGAEAVQGQIAAQLSGLIG